jgi:hypothetical protein
MAEMNGIRLNDWFVFHQAAQAFGVWILVRWTNPYSLKYIGQRAWDPRTGRSYDYVPKPIDCKPKTANANVGKYEIAGLVVDPTIHGMPSAKAADAWNEFLQSHKVATGAELNRKSLTAGTSPLARPSLGQAVHIDQTRAGVDSAALKQALRRGPSDRSVREFRVDLDPASRHYGCLTLNGAYLHGDYDLKDIVNPRKLGPNTAIADRLHNQPHMRTDEFEPIQKYVNDRIGVPMLQHGGEAQFHEHTEDTIEVFGPSGQAHTLRGRGEIARWYKYGWNRQTIDAKSQKANHDFAPPSRVHHSTSQGGLIIIGADPRS